MGIFLMGGNGVHKRSTSSSLVMDTSGTVLNSIKYTAFRDLCAPEPGLRVGGEIRSGTTDKTDYKYTGQRSEEEIGLYFYNARFYDPALGRFTQADTLVPDPASLKSYDRYAYVNNNPINFNDPNGHHRCNPNDGDYNPGNCVSSITNYGVHGVVSSGNGNNNTLSTTTTILINNCGWGTGTSSETNYEGIRPLSPITSVFQNWSENGHVIYNGFIGKGNPNKIDEGKIIYKQKVENISENNNSQIYLVAHNAGIDATIYALQLLAKEHPDWIKNIAGVAILDVDLSSNPEITNDIGQMVYYEYKSKMIFAYSRDYNAPGFSIDPNDIKSFSDLHHEQLATDQSVTNYITELFGW